jgi:5'-deoxynucleotidase YfbR-like HD superfamily hydrolase
MQSKVNVEGLNEEWILSEIEKIKYTYGLNKVIRYNLNRHDEKLTTQSVAEHVYNMLILAHYFRDLEDPSKKLDFEKVTRMILMHDMSEIEVGDTIAPDKVAQTFENEKLGLVLVQEKSPNFIQIEIKTLCGEYDNFTTPESRFVKCLDKIEQSFWIAIVNDLSVLKSVNTVDQRIKSEEKRVETYEKTEYRIIEKFGNIIWNNAVKKGILE